MTGRPHTSGNSGVVVVVAREDKEKIAEQRNGWWKKGTAMGGRSSAIAVQVDTKEEEAVRRKKRRRIKVKKTGSVQEQTIQVGAKDQDVEDKKTTKKNPAKTGWYRRVEVIVGLLLWLWGTL